MLKNLIVLKMPIELMKQAIKSAAKSKKDQSAVDEERRVKYLDKTEAQIRQYAGEDGVQKYLADLAEFDARKREIAEKAQAEIRAAWEKAVAFIDEETTPRGEEVQNEPDFALLDHDIVDADQLERLIEKHKDNRSFRQAAARYALRQGWQDSDQFTAIDKENAVREYVNQIFDRLMFAADHPASPTNMMYVETPNEYYRIAKAYGIEEEYLASGGETLNTAIKDLF